MILITRRVCLQQEQLIRLLRRADPSPTVWQGVVELCGQMSALHLSPFTGADNRDDGNVHDGAGDTESAWDQAPRHFSALQTTGVALIERVWIVAAVRALMGAIVPHVTLY